MFDWKSATLAIALVLGVGILPEGEKRPTSTVQAADVGHDKVTELGLYLSSTDAYSFLQDHPETVFIDTRDPVEISVMGHPQGIDAIVPINVHSNEYIESRAEYALVRNPQFEASWANLSADLGVAKDDLIIVTCGNGRRSAIAVDALFAQGYTNVWHIVDGYDGEEVEDRNGRNTQNAWRLAGLPWEDTDTLPGSEFMMVIN